MSEKKPTKGQEVQGAAPVMYIGPNLLAKGLKTYTVYKQEPTELINSFKEEYKHIKEHKEEYPPELVGYCGYQLSYGGKFFDCYRRDKVGKRDYCREAYNFTFKQVPHLEGIEFYIKDYKEIDEPKGAVIYCDPPYRDTGKYTAVGGFNHEEFYEWVARLAKDNIVLVSEYYMPEDIAVELWHKEVKVCLDSKRASGKKNIERLFKING